MKHLNLKPVCVMILLLCASADAAGAESVALVKNGRAAVYLVRDATPGQPGDVAVADLKRCLWAISDVEISESSRTGLLPLYVGEKGQFTSLPVSVPELGREAFFYKVSPQGIFLIGRSPEGTSHAIYTLLRELGCRWIMPGDIGECLPRTNNLALPVDEKVDGPDFDYRIVWYAYGCSPAASARYNDWLRRNRMGKPAIEHGHNLIQTLSRKATYEQHPEYYSLVGGKRVPQQVCTSNPEAVKLIVESIREFLDKNPHVESYSLCPDDNHDFCECEHCKALDVGHMDRGGKPSVSDRYQIFLNQVLDGLHKTHPGACVTTYSYNLNHTDPPQKTPVNPHTTVFITTSAFCSAHGVGDAFCESRQDFKELLKEWSRHTKRLILYEYDPVPYSGALPWPMWEAHIHEAPIYKQLGIKGLSFEGQNSWAAYYPNYYVAAQMMWDADQDGHAVFKDMLQAFFEEEAPAMEQFYEAMQSTIKAFRPKAEWGLIQYPELFPPEVIDRCQQALDSIDPQAMRSVKVRQRLQMVELSFQEMKNYLALQSPQKILNYEDYKAHVDGMKGSIDSLHSLNEDFILADIAHEKTGRAISDQFAPEQGFLTRWRLIGPFDNPGMEGHDTPYPPESAVDLSARYPGKGGEVQWKMTQSPEWRAFVDLRAEFEEKNDVCAYAVCWVTIPDGPRQAEFRMGSNDSIKAFLNGKEVWNHKIQRTGTIDEDRVQVELPSGTSTVLLKIGQTGLNWGFFFRIMEAGKDVPLQGLTASPDPPK